MRKHKLEPLGQKIIVEEMPKEFFETEGSIVMVDTQLTTGKVVEFSKEFKEVYKKGDLVIFPKGAGTGIPYNGKAHTVLNGGGAPNFGDIWFIVNEER